jgi:hypothetical protein
MSTSPGERHDPPGDGAPTGVVGHAPNAPGAGGLHRLLLGARGFGPLQEDWGDGADGGSTGTDSASLLLDFVGGASGSLDEATRRP